MKKVVTIEKLDHFGRGIAHVDGKVLFVNGAFPLETCEVEYVKEKKKYIEADTRNVLIDSLNRVPSPCPYDKWCGGCQLLHLSEEGQAHLKEEKVKELLWKYASIGEEKILPLKTGKGIAYRNKITLHGRAGKLGFYRGKSRDIVSIDTCLMVHPILNQLIPKLTMFAKENKNVKEVTLRLGNETNEVMLVVTGEVSPEKLASAFRSSVTSLYLNDELIFGKKTIISKVLGMDFFVSPTSFFQVNVEMVSVLYQTVLDLVKAGSYHRALDLYCGTGTIGLLLSHYVEEVVGIEIIKSAIVDAKENAKQNAVTNCTFYEGKVEEILPTIAFEFDLIVVDPPRTGLDHSTVEALKKRKPSTIIYISCDPVTLARDISLLDNYEVSKIQPVDMFPGTYHVECVCLLNRR